MVSSWTYALVFVCSQYATKTIAKEFNNKKKMGEGKALSCKDKKHGKGQRQRREIDGLVVSWHTKKTDH